MSDPNWNDGRYYGNTFPRIGMQHARYMCSCLPIAISDKFRNLKRVKNHKPFPLIMALAEDTTYVIQNL